MAAGVFDVDTALEHLDWYPFIDSCTGNARVSDQDDGAGDNDTTNALNNTSILPDWIEFPMVQQSNNSKFSSSDGDETDHQLLDEILDVSGYCDPKQALPTSPHSVLEQVSPTATKYEDSMEEDAHQVSSDIHHFYTGEQVVLQDEFIGCRLFHLLLAGAEAMFSPTLDLARVILLRLRELSSASPSSPVFQRIAFYFTEGLQSLLDGTRIAKVAGSRISYLDTLTAFQALHEASPYIKFGHYVANQAILDSIGDDKRVHIIDYDLSVGIQWPSLMQALAMREGGAPHLRITTIHRPHIKHPLANFQETKDRLMECAAAFRVPFTFHQAKIDDDDGDPKLIGLRLVKGETIIVNCMLHLLHMPHKSPASVSAFLRSVRALSPKLVTFVEEEVMSSAGASSLSSVERFFQALQHYSAVMDSLEASLCETTSAHILVERAFLGTRIKTALIAGHQHPEIRDWSGVLLSAGFQQLPLSRRNVCQAKLLLGLFKDGYQLEETLPDETMRLRLSWKSRPLMAASAWSCKVAADEEELQ